MPILTKEVTVKPMGKAIKYYRDLGYDAKHKQPLTVSIDDLLKGSDAEIEVLCDFCLENTITLKYNTYNNRTKETGCYPCKECIGEKVKLTNLKRYGVPYPIQLEAFKEKRVQTTLEKYGVENYAQTKECHEKMEQTCLELYGVEHYTKTEEYKKKREATMIEKYGVPNYAQTQECKEKRHNTCVEKYGEDYGKQFWQKAFNTFYEKTGYQNPSQSPEVREKITQTYISHYGVDHPNKLPEVRAKANETLCKNGTVPTSKQQIYLHGLYGGELNYPISCYAIDICFPEERIAIEYDGGGHDLKVVFGTLTQEEFDQKEVIRNVAIKKEGYKQMKIISSKDFLPSDKILLQMLEDAKEYFNTTSHSWINFDIDNSIMINAENKDIGGIAYDYGKLRTIKEIA